MEGCEDNKEAEGRNGDERGESLSSVVEGEKGDGDEHSSSREEEEMHSCTLDEEWGLCKYG